MSKNEVSVRANLITKRTYNRPKEDGSFESWDETVDRVVGHQRWLWEQAKHAKLNKVQVAELEELRQLMLDRKALMSGRSLWLGGTEISRTRMSSMFNCSFTNVETVYDVVDCFWLLLQGCGVGFRPIRGTLNGFSNSIKDIQIVRSTRTDKGGHDKNIESYDRATKTWTIKIGDSAEAWAKSIGKLLAGKYPANTLILDFSALRPAGERLKGYGWISSGDEAIAKAYEKIAGIMSKRAGNLLSAIDILDIVNHLGTVLSSRRSAQICIMDADDFEANAFAIAKKDFWLHDNSHRCQSNNSLVFHKKPSIEQLSDLFALMERAGGSEPGFINAEAATKRAPWFSGVNPCCVTGDMLIQTKNGLRKAHSLLDNNYLAMVNGTAYKSETGFWETGTKEVYLITTDIGVKSKATIDHRFKLDNDTWSELGDINIGDKLQLSINSHEVKINKSDFDKGWLVGEIAGDGGYNPSKYPTYLGFWGESQREMSEIAINIINNLDVDYSRPVKLNFDKKIDYNGRLTITSKVMDKFCEKYLTEHDKDIKDDLFEESESFQLGFVRGLFDADGSVQGNLNKGVSIRLTQVNLNRLEIVQQILLSVGIVSKIYKNRMAQGERLLPDSDRELKLYPCKAVHELIISNESFSKFGKLIGFYEPAKQERFVNIENSRLRNPYCDKHIAKIVSIESLGEQVVYDTNVSEISAFSSNGLIAHNCEILLGNKSFCNLTELDIGKFHGDTDGLNRALYIMGRANYRQTIVNLKDGILQEAWHLNNEFLRLCGVGLTGIARRPDLMAYDYQSMQRIATSATMGMADELGLQKPKNTTTVKPSGTLSKIMDTTEGVHKPLGRYIFNNVVFSNHDENLQSLRDANYKIIPHPNDNTSCIVCFPVSWDDVPFDNWQGMEVNLESAITQLDRYALLQNNWTQQNTSVTISYSPEEVPDIIQWLLNNWDLYVGVSFLYRADPTKTAEMLGYQYLPQEVVTKEAFDEYKSILGDVITSASFTEIESQECINGVCPVK